MNDNQEGNVDRDLMHMRACLELAGQAQGRTHPNPLVGAVVVSSDGVVVGRGFHQRAGTAHAEVHALTEAGERARGATLYVNLEPCCHFGKTPPCSDLVVSSGVSRVVAAMADPNPKVAGGGLEQLRNAGISVDVGLLKTEAEWLNRGFLKRINRGLPWLCLKLAVTMDSRIADRLGTSRWITGEESRHKVHELRDKFDAVLVGSKTLIVDDPELTVREIPNSRNPIRVALDHNLQIALDSRFLATNPKARTIIFACKEALRLNEKNYPEHIELIGVPSENGRIDLKYALESLAKQGINTVLCEGGGKLAGSLLEQELIDELYWIVAPKLIGDAQAIPGVQIDHHVPLAQAWEMRVIDVERIGNDTWIHGRL